MVRIMELYNPYADVRYCDILAVFEILDTNAEFAATATASDECDLSQLRQTHDRIEQMTDKVAALERDYWMLDGTFILPEQENLNQTGWWSDSISDTGGIFYDPPHLTFTWQENRDSTGLTICFDDKAGEYPTLFNVYAYDYTGALINQTTVENSGVRCIVDMPTEDYRQIVFEFLETSKPHRRVRVAEVLFGVVQQFDRDNIVSASLEIAFTPDGASLPATELNLTIDNSDKSWNMANPQGVYAYLQQSQPIRLHLGINGEWVYMGEYYFTGATAEDNALTARITAHDKIYTLDGKIYQGPPSESWAFNQAVTAVLAFGEVNLNYYMTGDIASRQISGTLPDNISCREALRLLTQAARCSCYIGRDGVLRFFDPHETQEVVDVLDFDNMSAMPKISVDEKINVVELKVGENIYTASNVGIDEAVRVASYDNPLVLDENGGLTAAWLLALRQRRFLYKVWERGNPARDVSDSVVIHDPYGGIRAAVVTLQKYNFDGGLKCEVEGIGVS